MANPQVEDGFIRIAREIHSALCRFRIPGEARQVFDFIQAKTWGWGKKEDRIPLSQFVLGTGLRKKTIVKARKRLVEMNLISITKLGDDEITLYKINKDFDAWKSSPKKDTSPNKGTSIPQFGEASSPNWGPSIDNSSKDTIQKRKRAPKKVSEDAVFLTELLLGQILKNHPNLLLRHADEQARARRNWPPDFDALIRKGRSPPEIREMIHWATSDEFWTANILSAGALRRKWDTLVAQKGRKKHGTNQRESDQIDANLRVLDDFARGAQRSGFREGDGGLNLPFPESSLERREDDGLV